MYSRRDIFRIAIRPLSPGNPAALMGEDGPWFGDRAGRRSLPPAPAARGGRGENSPFSLSLSFSLSLPFSWPGLRLTSGSREGIRSSCLGSLSGVPFAARATSSFNPPPPLPPSPPLPPPMCVNPMGTAALEPPLKQRKSFKRGFDVGSLGELTEQALKGGVRLPGRHSVAEGRRIIYTDPSFDMRELVKPGNILRIGGGSAVARSGSCDAPGFFPSPFPPAALPASAEAPPGARHNGLTIFALRASPHPFTGSFNSRRAAFGPSRRGPPSRAAPLQRPRRHRDGALHNGVTGPHGSFVPVMGPSGWGGGKGQSPRTSRPASVDQP